MKCPVCGREMEKGGIIVDGAIVVSWHPEREFVKKGIKSIIYLDGKMIGQSNVLLRRVKIPNAWFCKECNKIVGLFDVKEYATD